MFLFVLLYISLFSLVSSFLFFLFFFFALVSFYHFLTLLTERGRGELPENSPPFYPFPILSFYFLFFTHTAGSIHKNIKKKTKKQERAYKKKKILEISSSLLFCVCRERLEEGAIAFAFRGCCPNKKGRGSFIFCWTEIKKESPKKRRKLKKRRRGGLLSLSFSFFFFLFFYFSDRGRACRKEKN
jgi:hypothetical protein